MEFGDREKAGAEWRQFWPIPFTSMLGLMVGAIYIYSLGLFIDPLQQEYGWSRTQITLGLTLVSVITVTLAPFMGMIIDRFGARTLAMPGMAIYCTAIASLSMVGSEIWMWWLGWFFVALGSVCIKPTVWSVAVSTYFTAGRGLAIAVALCGTGLGQIFLPYITNWMVDGFGWRIAYATLGIGGAALVLPIMFLFFYDARENNRRKGITNTDRLTLPGCGLREGYLSRRFLFLAITALVATAGIVGIVVHFVPMLSSGGVERSSAAAIAGVIGVTSMTGRVVAGYLLDRIDGRVIGALAYGFPCLGCFLLLQFDGSTSQAIILAAVIGLSLGAEIDVLAYLASRHFGLRNYGTIFGTLVGLITLGGGLGPLLIGMIFDSTGAYTYALWIFIPAFLCVSVLIASLGSYPVFDVYEAAKIDTGSEPLATR